MKQLLFIITLISALECSGQKYDTTQWKQLGSIYSLGTTENYSLFLQTDNVRMFTKMDTTVLYKGDVKCKHHFATKDVRTGYFSGNVSCLVNHGITGCPDTWRNDNLICTICLRHINVKEKRWTEKIPDEYEEALEKLNKKLTKQ